MTVFKGDPGEVGEGPIGGSPTTKGVSGPCPCPSPCPCASPCPCTEMNLVRWDPAGGAVVKEVERGVMSGCEKGLEGG